MGESLTIWCNADLSVEAHQLLATEAAGHFLVFPEERTSNLAAGGPSAALVGADIAFGQPDPGQVISLPALKWVHLTSAGYTRYDNEEVRGALRNRDGRLSNSSSVYDDPCAQQVLAFMLAQARRLPECFRAQQSGLWDYGVQRPRMRILQEDSVAIVGYGAIGRRLVELLQPFRLSVSAFRRRPRGDEGVPTFAIGELRSRISEADHIVNIVPASAESDRMFSSELLAAAKPGAVFYNIGRGTTVDQSALIDALASGHLAAAYLDVTDPEPLPTDHPLWTAPNCIIAPHLGGGRQDETTWLVRHFAQNLRRYLAGEELLDRLF